MTVRTLRSIGKGASILAGGAVLGQGITAAVSPLLTRMYSPHEFGIFGVFVGFLYFGLALASLRYDVPLVVERRASRSGSLMWLALIPIPIVAVLFGVTSYLVTGFGSFRESSVYWVGLPVGILFGSLYNIGIRLSLKQQLILGIAKTRAIQASVSAITQIVFAIANFGAVGLVAGQVFGMGMGIKKLWPREIVLPKINLARLRAVAIRYRKYPLYDGPAALSQIANTHLPAILIAALTSPTLAGVYALTQRVFATPLAILANAVSNSLISHSEITDDMASAARSSVASAHSLLSIVITPLVTIISLVIMKYFGFFFGSQWDRYGAIAAWLVVFVGHKFLFDSAAQLLSVTQNVKQGLVLQAGILLIRMLSLIGSILVMSDAMAGIMIFSVVSAAVYSFGGACQRALLNGNWSLSKLSFPLVEVVFSLGVVGLASVNYFAMALLIFVIYLCWLGFRIILLKKSKWSA